MALNVPRLQGLNNNSKADIRFIGALNKNMNRNEKSLRASRDAQCLLMPFRVEGSFFKLAAGGATGRVQHGGWQSNRRQEIFARGPKQIENDRESRRRCAQKSAGASYAPAMRVQRKKFLGRSAAQAALWPRDNCGALNCWRRLPARSATTRIRSATGAGISLR